MKPDLLSIVWELPGSRSFVRRAGLTLRDGISLFCLFPSRMEADSFQDQLLHHLEQELVLRVRSVDLRWINEGSPFEILRRLLPEGRTYQYLEQMVSDPELPQVILISHLEGRETGEIQDWVKSLARWAEACRSSGSLNSLGLLMPFDLIKDTRFPLTDVRLTYAVWPGAPSALDVRVLCRSISEETNAEAQWREYLLASLSGSDLQLAESLWEYTCEPVATLLLVLEQYARSRNWSPDEIRKQLQKWRPVPAGQLLVPEPHANGFNLIRCGWAVYTPEYGEEIHTAALIMLGRQQEVIHRIWRAQAALMLPMIDDIRRRICNHLADRYGSQWVVIDNEHFELPLDMGKLKRYFDLLPSTSWEKKQWGRGIAQVWSTRNELAHYEPVSYATFHEIWRLYSLIHGMPYRAN